MGSGALKACEVSLQNKYVMLINTDESDVDVESTSMNPANVDLVVCARGIPKHLMQIRSQRGGNNSSAGHVFTLARARS